MKKLLRPLIGVGIFVTCVGGLWITKERDPAFQQHLTTFNGKPAVGQLHHDGSYSFYEARPWWGSLQYYQTGPYIGTFPGAEAAKLH